MLNLNNIGVYYEINKGHFPDNGNRKNLYLATCAALHPGITPENIEELEKFNLKLLEQNPYGGVIGIGNSCFELIFSHFKIFRLHAAFHDASGFMKSYFNAGPGYCYTLSFPLNSCFLGHVTGLAYCVYLKYFTPFLKIFDV